MTIHRGQKSAVVSEVELAPDSIVLATLQASVNGLQIEGITKDLGGSSFTVGLTRAAPSDIDVGWLILG